MSDRGRSALILLAGILFFGGFVVAIFTEYVLGGVLMSTVATFLSIGLAMTTESSRARLRPGAPPTPARSTVGSGRVDDGLDHLATTGALDASEVAELKQAAATRSVQDMKELVVRVKSLHDLRARGDITFTEYLTKKRSILS